MKDKKSKKRSKESKKPRIVIEYAMPNGVQYADLNDSPYPFYVNALESVKNISPAMDNLVIRASDKSSGLEITFERRGRTDATPTITLTPTLTVTPPAYQSEKVEPNHDQPQREFTVELIDPGKVQITGIHVFYRDDFTWATKDIQEILANTAPLYGKEPPPITFHPVSGYDDIFSLKVERIMQVVAISESDRKIMVLPELDMDLMVDELNSGEAITFHVPPEWMHRLLDRLEFASLAEFQQEIENPNTVVYVTEAAPPLIIPKVYDQLILPGVAESFGGLLVYFAIRGLIERIWPKKKE